MCRNTNGMTLPISQTMTMASIRWSIALSVASEPDELINAIIGLCESCTLRTRHDHYGKFRASVLMFTLIGLRFTGQRMYGCNSLNSTRYSHST